MQVVEKGHVKLALEWQETIFRQSFRIFDENSVAQGQARVTSQ